MKRFARLMMAVALVATLGLASACQRTVEVQTGTRTVDSQGRVISENIKTIRVPAETASAYRVNTITQADSPDVRLAALYGEAQSAISSGNLELAAAKLAQVIAISPSYRKAKAQSEAIKAGKKVKADTTPLSPSNPSSPSNPTNPANPSTTPTSTRPGNQLGDNPTALQVWTPDKLTGFTPVKLAFDALSASREYIPESGSPAKTFVIVAEQFRDSGDAKASLDYNIKQRYPKDASTFTSHGHTVYFGTDGSRFAALGFTDGAVMVALEASPDSGAPAAMKSLLEKALSQLP